MSNELSEKEMVEIKSGLKKIFQEGVKLSKNGFNNEVNAIKIHAGVEAAKALIALNKT